MSHSLPGAVPRGHKFLHPRPGGDCPLVGIFPASWVPAEFPRSNPVALMPSCSFTVIQALTPPQIMSALHFSSPMLRRINFNVSKPELLPHPTRYPSSHLTANSLFPDVQVKSQGALLDLFLFTPQVQSSHKCYWLCLQNMCRI